MAAKDLQTQTSPGTKVQEYQPPGEVQPAKPKTFVDSEGFANLMASSGTLRLTEGEKSILYKDFKDDEIEIRENGAVYIPFMTCVKRLFEVFGGEWSVIPIDQPIIKDGAVIWGFALIVRGVYISAAYGANQYFPNNPNQDYSDCLEGAKSVCLRRLCKGMGIGSKLWDKNYVKKWKEKYAAYKTETYYNGKEKKVWFLKKDAPKKGGKTTPPPEKKTSETPPPASQEEPEQSTKKFGFPQAVEIYIQDPIFKDFCKKHRILNMKDFKQMVLLYHEETDIAKITLDRVFEWEKFMKDGLSEIQEANKKDDTGQRKDQPGPEESETIDGPSERRKLPDPTE